MPETSPFITFDACCPVTARMEVSASVLMFAFLSLLRCGMELQSSFLLFVFFLEDKLWSYSAGC